MKARKRGAAGSDIAVQRLEDKRYVLIVDGIVRYVGTREASRKAHRIHAARVCRIEGRLHGVQDEEARAGHR